MLAEALEGDDVIATLGTLEPFDFRKIYLDGRYDLTAAAEAFLAKVREAEAADTRSATIRVVAEDTIAHYPTIMGELKKSEHEDPDHTGPVPYLGEVG